MDSERGGTATLVTASSSGPREAPATAPAREGANLIDGSSTEAGR